MFFAQTMDLPDDPSQSSLLGSSQSSLSGSSLNPQSSLASSSLLIKLIASRADDDVLRLMSQTPLWEIISPELSNQHFWYLRTQTLLNFDINWNEKENWHQVYNILSDKNPFSTEGTLELQENGYNLFAVETLLRLGYDPSVDDSRSIIFASEFGSPEVVKLLLRDKRIDTSKLRSGLRRYLLLNAAKKNWLDILLSLLEDPGIGQSIVVIPNYSPLLYPEDKRKFKEYIQKINPKIAAVNNALCIAAEVGSVIIVRELLQDPRVDPNVRDRFPLRITIEERRTEVVKALLEDKRLIIDTSPRGDLEYSSEGNRTDIMRLLLGDSRTYDALELRMTLLKTAIDRSQGRPVSLLLEDLRVDPLGKIASEALRRIGRDQSLDDSKGVSNMHDSEAVRIWKLDLEYHMKNRRRVAEALIRSRNLDFRDSPEHRGREYMHAIISLVYKNIRDSVEGCILLSGGKFTVESHSGRELNLILLLGNGERDTLYDNTHYSALLREIILKRLDLEYYLQWILKQLENKSTSAKTRMLFSSVAKSLLSERPIHTSEWFTAYRGFMLLTVSQDARVILNTLGQEEGVTQEGINLAGALLGAFLGKKIE